VLLGFIGRGSFGSILLGMSTLLYVGVPSILLAFLSVLMGRFLPNKSAFFNRLRRYAVIVFVFAGHQSLGIMIGNHLHKIDLNEARQFCEQLDQLPVDERSSFSTKANIRWIEHVNYHDNDGSFHCSFPDPQSMFTIWYYMDSKWTSD